MKRNMKPSDYESVVTADSLTPKQEAFAQLVAGGSTAADAYRRAFDVSPDIARQTVLSRSYELMRRPDVATRVASLRVAISEAFVNNLANMRARQFEIAVAEPLTEVRVFNCRHCYGVGHRYQWRDEAELQDAVAKAQASQDTPLPEPMPDPRGGFDFDPFEAPAEDCPECLGAGRPVVYVRDTTRLPPGQRAAFKGAHVDRWGGIHVEQHDQQEAARELARMIPGAIAPQRSESKVAHLHVEPLKDMTPEQIVAVMAEQKLIPNG